MPAISVIVPVYNTENYIHRCIDSILSQTFEDFELLLVDDGSTDNSGAICDEYAEKDSRIVVFHQTNQGQAAARNFALDWVFANSDSKYISFVDSDDWVHPQYLEFLYDAAKRFDAPISQCLHLVTDGTDRLREEATIENVDISCISPEEQYMHYYSAVMWDKLFHRSCWESRRFPEGQIYEDLAICYQLLFAEAKIAIVKERLYFYYFNSDGTVHSDWTSANLARIQAWDDQLSFFSGYGNKELLQDVVKKYCRIAYEEYTAVGKSASLSKDSKREYQALFSKKMRRIILRNPFQIPRWYYSPAFPHLSSLYWHIRGSVDKKARP